MTAAYTKHDRVTAELDGKRVTLTITRSRSDGQVYDAVTARGAKVVLAADQVKGLA